MLWEFLATLETRKEDVNIDANSHEFISRELSQSEFVS